MKIVTLALVASLGLAGPALANDLNVAFVNPGGEDGFWGAVSETMQAAADDLDIDLEILHSNRDRTVMVDFARELSQRAEAPDYVVIVNELQQGEKMAEMLTAADIPSFFLLNRLGEEQEMPSLNLAGSVTPDNEIAGYEMATSLIEAVRASGQAEDGVQILALLGDFATPAALQRQAGLIRAVEEAGDAEIVREMSVEWSAEQAKERTGRFLKRLSADAIWAANDPISFGAQEAAREAGFTPGTDMFFAGLNWSAPALAAVDEGTMTLTHGGHFFAGAWAMVILHDIANGHATHGEHVDFPMSAVTSENVAAFLRDIAPGDFDAIDFSTFSMGAQSAEVYSFTAQAILSAAGTGS